MLFIFDLDGTVIDSAHRRAALPNGDIDLDHWRENSTPEMIARDTLLPLADGWRSIDRRHHQIAVMTARVTSSADIKFLADHGLHYDFFYSRPEYSVLADADLKSIMLRQLKRDSGRSWKYLENYCILWDDNESVRDRLTDHGIRCYDPTFNNTNLRFTGTL